MFFRMQSYFSNDMFFETSYVFLNVLCFFFRNMLYFFSCVMYF